MKKSHQSNIFEELKKAGAQGLSRDFFEADRSRFGVAWLRRLQEIEESYFMEKSYKNDLISHWKLGNRRLQQIKLIQERLIFMGQIAEMECYAVLP